MHKRHTFEITHTTVVVRVYIVTKRGAKQQKKNDAFGEN